MDDNNNNNLDENKDAIEKEKNKDDEKGSVKEFLKLKQHERGKIASAYVLLSQIAIQLLVIMCMMFFLGRWLDQKLGTSPLFLLLCILLGMASAFKSMYDIGMNEVKKFEKHDKSYRFYKKYNKYDDEDDNDNSDF